MGSLRKHTLGAVFLAAMSPYAAGAEGLVTTPTDQLHFFATCAGRLSALTEHHWMFDGPASELTARQNLAVPNLLDSVSRLEQSSMVMGWRIEAKVAHRALLSSAAFGRDPRRAETGRQQA